MKITSDDRQAAAADRRRWSSSTSPTDDAPRRAGRPGARARRRASTACCTRSGSPRRARSTSSRPRWDDVSTALHVSAYSLTSARRGRAAADGSGGQRSSGSPSTRGSPGRSTTGWAWRRPRSSRPTATSPATSAPRASACNLVAAGPIRTTAAKSIPGFERFEDVWDGRAPLGWDVDDAEPTAKACVALLSDWFPATTGEMRARRRRLPRDGRLRASTRLPG